MRKITPRLDPDSGFGSNVVDLEAADLVGYPINTDDRPTFEYYWIERMLRRKKDPRVFLDAMDLSRHTTDVKVKLP